MTAGRILDAFDLKESQMASRIGMRLIDMLTAAALFLNCGPAFADAIDGDWCHADGRQLTINGPDIVTPGGTRMKGDYDRHHFSYVVPASEPGGGGTVSMVLQSELQMLLKPPQGESQTWRRCGKPVS
jgi:hypothetical protein